MNIGKFCPLPLCTLIGNFRIYLYIVSLVVILLNWVCDNWVYRFPIFGPLLKPTGLWEEVHCGRQIAHTHCWYLKRVKFWFRCLVLVASEFHRRFVAMSVRDPQGQTNGNCIRAECLTVL